MFSKSRRTRSSVTLLTLLAALAITGSASAALFVVYPAGTFPLFKSYSTHAADWWKWALKQPADKSALLDATGANCGQGQSGAVWYLAGTFGGDPVTRSCTIPGGRTLVFPVLNALYAAFPTDPADQQTEAFVRSQVTYIESAQQLSLKIDGQTVTNLNSFLEKSDLFSVVLPANNIFGADAGQILSPVADEGYYVAVAPLLPGKHTLQFGGTVGGNTVAVTYNLNVKLLP